MRTTRCSKTYGMLNSHIAITLANERARELREAGIGQSTRGDRHDARDREPGGREARVPLRWRLRAHHARACD